ncbi:MAG: T9SS type A sorting domain-containing protein [Bacteroidota bacterium]
MKRVLLLALGLVVSVGLNAQIITITGGPGKVPGTSNQVYRGLPFDASVSGINGTVQRWSAGIGTVNNQNVFFTSSTTVHNVVIDRGIDNGTTGLIAVGATNGRGVARYVTIVEPPSNPTLNVGFCVDGFITATVNDASGASSYTWLSPQNVTTSSPSRTFFVTSGSFVTFRVRINGGPNNGQILEKTQRILCLITNPGDGPIPRGAEELVAPELQVNEPIELYPNPTNNGLVNLRMISADQAYQIEVISPAGQSMKVINGASSEYELDVKDLPSGVYYLRVKGNSGYIQTQRLVVE